MKHGNSFPILFPARRDRSTGGFRSPVFALRDSPLKKKNYFTFFFIAGSMSLQQLIVESSQLLENQQPEQAVELLRSKLDQFGESPLYLQTIGEAYLENGDVENAYQVLKKACELDPNANEGVEKFLYLGQIVGGRDGVQFLEIGVKKLLSQLELVQSESSQPLDESTQLLFAAYTEPDKVQEYLLKKLNQGLFGIIEIWMTDLCMEPEAEEECEKCIQLALSLDETNGESWSLLASIRISQQKTQDARDAVKKAWDLFESKKTVLEDAADPETQMEYIDLCQPLITLAKYAIETGLLELATTIASSVQDINEQSVESFYLEGFGYLLIAKRNQNGVSEQDGDKVAVAFDEYPLKQADDTVKEARLALTEAYKLLQVDSVVAETDADLVDTVMGLVTELGGPLFEKASKDEVDLDDLVDEE
ncbi:hypothetical protein OGAPHI_007000 [Ogataea philodendri]|uniref:Assembly chaperone of RPL4 n=1 Tax=Ogataea philodendri TaxID=1378263 RepID=A0A9P8NVX6_9ASCO|nr:uncharacterized protein OGAPHI_007000 [Ogataea philodendri]KAH3660414.1 hypothetical protein OGAPHI_007000 [Ogataea philodendri]